MKESLEFDDCLTEQKN